MHDPIRQRVLFMCALLSLGIGTISAPETVFYQSAYDGMGEKRLATTPKTRTGVCDNETLPTLVLWARDHGATGTLVPSHDSGTVDGPLLFSQRHRQAQMSTLRLAAAERQL